MEIRIGVVYSPKEIEVDLGDDADPGQVVDDITAAMSGDNGMLWLTDRRGRKVGIPTSKLTYVEVGGDAGGRHVGFSAI